jgi:hypothetical protein
MLKPSGMGAGLFGCRCVFFSGRVCWCPALGCCFCTPHGEAFQLVPLRKALAGLILREMLLRQWQEEMASRFGLTSTVMDRAYVAKARQERGYGTNPWSTGSRFLISHALLRKPDDASPLISPRD